MSASSCWTFRGETIACQLIVVSLLEEVVESAVSDPRHAGPLALVQKYILCGESNGEVTGKPIIMPAMAQRELSLVGSIANSTGLKLGKLSRAEVGLNRLHIHVKALYQGLLEPPMPALYRPRFD